MDEGVKREVSERIPPPVKILLNRQTLPTPEMQSFEMPPSECVNI